MFEFEDEPLENIQALIEKYEEAIKKQEYPSLDPENIERIIEFYEFEGNYQRAMQVVDFGIEQYPYSSILKFKKAQLLYDIKSCEQALIYINEALTFDPGETSFLLLKSEILTFLSRYEEALEILKKMEDNADKEDLPDIYLQMADLYEDKEKYEKVFSCLKSCLNIDANNDEALNRINYCVEILENFEDSVDLHKNIIDEHPYSYFAWYNLATAYAGLHLYEKALEAIDFALAIDEDLEFAYKDKADFHYMLGEYDKAIEALKTFNKLTSGTEEGYMLEGDCYLALDKPKIARYCYRKAININPASSKGSYMIGLTHGLEKEWDLAEKAYLRAIEIDSENYVFWGSLSQAYTYLRDFEKAAEAANKVIELKGNIEEGYFLLARIFAEEGHYQDAAMVLNVATKKCKELIKVPFAIAANLYLWKKRKEALIQMSVLLEENYYDNVYFFQFAPKLIENQNIMDIVSYFNPKK